MYNRETTLKEIYTHIGSEGDFSKYYDGTKDYEKLINKSKLKHNWKKLFLYDTKSPKFMGLFEKAKSITKIDSRIMAMYKFLGEESDFSDYYDGTKDYKQLINESKLLCSWKELFLYDTKSPKFMGLFEQVNKKLLESHNP